MKKYLPILASMLLATPSAFAGFWISGKNLKDSRGNTFVIRGINNPHSWFDYDAYNAIPDLANSKKCNTVRIVWNRNKSASRLNEIINQCEAYKMIPMVEIHDGTGSTSAYELNENAKYFANNSWVFKDNANSVLINIANEWGNSSTTDTQWRDAYKTAITTIRNSGIITTLVIDCPGWGQRASAALNQGQALLNHDPNYNLMFSVHMYGSWNTANDIYNCMQNFSNRNFPLVIGEFGWNYNNGNNNLGCRVDHKKLMEWAKQFGTGYLAWSLKGNDSSNAWLDLTTNWRNTTSPWGNDVFWGTNGISNTAKRATIY